MTVKDQDCVLFFIMILKRTIISWNILNTLSVIFYQLLHISGENTVWVFVGKSDATVKAV